MVYATQQQQPVAVVQSAQMYPMPAQQMHVVQMGGYPQAAQGGYPQGMQAAQMQPQASGMAYPGPDPAGGPPAYQSK